MFQALTIKDAAEASGFTSATLRYYERLGILPPAARTPAGYRTYDERTMALLAFIARAKQLGCTLDEIADLSTAWDGGQCGPVQDRLRELVAGKIHAAQAQIIDLMMFTSELQTAAATLEQHRPDGACDDECGCVSDPVPVSLSATPRTAGSPDVACTLSGGSVKARMDDWQGLLTHAIRREFVDGGVRVAFAHDVPTGELMRLVAAEQDCCQFFRFAITIDTRGVALEVRAPADALSIVTSMFGHPS